jgi:hypothetical protein
MVMKEGPDHAKGKNTRTSTVLSPMAIVAGNSPGVR